MVQKGKLRRLQVLAKSMSAGACLGELEAIIATAEQQVQSLKDQITVLGAILKACVVADDTYDPAALFSALARSLVMISNNPDQLIVVLKELLASFQYVNLTKEPKDWVAPSALTGAAGGPADAVSVRPAVATAVASTARAARARPGTRRRWNPSVAMERTSRSTRRTPRAP